MLELSKIIFITILAIYFMHPKFSEHFDKFYKWLEWNLLERDMVKTLEVITLVTGALMFVLYIFSALWILIMLIDFVLAPLWENIESRFF